ncbi:pilus assembly protein [Kaarinaea lacus]
MMDTIRKTTFTKTVLLTGLLATPLSSTVAGPLNLSNNALEVVNNVEPNIMILHDDSGSMDWGVMTGEGDEGTFHLGGNLYYYTHPDPGAAGLPPAVNDDTYVVPTEEFLQTEGLPAPQGGVWRAWNHSYNKMYYNPDITYTPWIGVNSGGNNFANASPTAALYNPNDPASGTLDLTTAISYGTDCGLVDCASIPTLVGWFTVTNFYPARYYEWTDSNSTTPANANNGVVDLDDDHTLVEIKSTTASYTRRSYNTSTGVGRSDCTDNSNGTATCTYNQEIQNFANWFSYYRKRDLSAKAAFSKVIEPINSARIGYATINNNASNAIRVASMNVSPNNGNKGTLLQRLFSTQPDNDTPLREALKKTGKYFECESNDIFGATGNSAPGSADCPVLAAPAGTCQANYTILITDGFWNGVNLPGVNNADAGGGDFDGGAFADGYSDTLADVAMHYYERDLQPTLNNEVPTTPRDIAGYSGATNPFASMHQHLSLYTVGFGVNGTLSAGPANFSTAFPWTDPTAGDAEKIDDVLHAAVNGRGLFTSANDPQSFQNAMDTILHDIKSNSGTATAVAFNTQEVEAGTLVFRASFNTKTNTGNLVAQRVNTNGTVDTNIRWSAAEQLDSKTGTSSDSRVIVTYKDTGSATSTGIPFRWTNLTTQQALLDSPQPASVLPATNTFGDERVDYLRGHSNNEGTNGPNGEFRERPQTAGKLGDIVHSAPVFVGKPHYIGRDHGDYPADPYSGFVSAKQNRTQLVYTGANDGMLHAFRADNGVEHFAYVPNIITQTLSDLTDPNYTHKYYVDLTPSVNDIYMTPTSGTNAGSASWNTVLVGGLGKGGKGYFSLNVTNPNDLNSEATAQQNVLWEFGEADDGGVGNSDLGYSYSEPLIAMSNADDGTNKRWVAIFGNGYNSTSANGNAHLYVLFIEAGQDGVWTVNTDFIKIDTGFGKATSSDGTTPNGIGGVRGIDSDGNGTVDYVYAGDLQGNLYRFDLTSATPTNWDSAPTILFKAKYSAGNSFPRNTVQPITKRPIVVSHPSGGYLVIATTGSWMTNDDTSDYSTQSIYGIWDDMSVSPEVTMNSVTNQLVKQAFTNHVSAEHGYTVRTLSDNPVSWQNNGNNANKVKGWYIDLDAGYAGERAVRNLQLRGNIIFVNTVIPRNATECSVGSGGFELAFDPFTGGPGIKTIFDLNNDHTFDNRDNVGDIDNVANIVTGIRFDNATPTDSAFIGSRRMTQAGDEIRSIDTNTGVADTTGRTSWREIE